MYELHGSPRSRAFRALWMLEELGVPYEHKNTGPRSPEIYALNPLGKVPAMKVGDDVLEADAVILGCGGFEADLKQRVDHFGPDWTAAKVRGTPHNTGDGLRMAYGLGAEEYPTLLDDEYEEGEALPRFEAPPSLTFHLFLLLSSRLSFTGSLARP